MDTSADKDPQGSTARGRKLSRRTFLEGATAGVLGSALGAAAAPAQGTPDPVGPPAGGDLQPVGTLPANITRTWLGPAFWANRLQDWRLHEGRIECLAGAAQDAVCTAALLTREITLGAAPAVLSARATLIGGGGGGGFCGFLIGAGSGKLDYRAAALVQKASGEGGGLLCTYETDGRARFREHTDENNPLAFAELPSEAPAAAAGAAPPKAGQEVLLRLFLLPQEGGRFGLRLAVLDPAGGELLAEAVRRGVAEAELLGGIALVSSPVGGAQGGARWAFRDVRSGGPKIAARPERALGPVLGAMHSLNGRVLKLNAQFLPIGEGEPQTARFQYRAPDGVWRDGPAAKIERGYTALFRLDDWDPTRDWEYRVVYRPGGAEPAYYAGTIRKDPGAGRPLVVGLFSCVLAAGRGLDGGVYKPEIPGEQMLGRYTAKNLYFPHAELVRNASRHRADLLVFSGDQLYEGNPTRKDQSPDPLLDYLYKWYLWVWSFREMTRSTPAIVQVDDHDMYQGNIWGAGGRPAPNRDITRGGYAQAPDWVNMVQRTQCGHNPDPYDPAPVAQGINVYYGAFRYGGVSFAVLEDRKFKSPAARTGAAPPEGERELLGARQEKFLAEWGKDKNAAVRVCLTQTAWACVQTGPNGEAKQDGDSNGYPKPARDRAIRLLRDAGALLLAGDQHLASLVRHGLDTHADGIVQFSGPAGGSQWQRWFEAGALPNPQGTPHTGDFADGYGNKFRVLAVANPKVTQTQFRQHHGARNNNLGDRALKSEGYGVVRVDTAARQFVIECWPWDVDPGAPGARQFAGWPHRLPFAEVAGSRTG